MNKINFLPLRNTVRLVLMSMLVIVLTFGSGQMAMAKLNPVVIQTPIFFGKAASFVILSKAGISNVPTSQIYGNLGVSPIAATAITGFSLVADSTNTFSTSPQVTGKIYAANYTSPTPTNLTKAIGNMQNAYNEAAGRTNPDFTELYAGDLSGRTLKPGLYKWSNSVVVNTSVMLDGGPNDVWIFQIAGNLTLAPGARVNLMNGASAKNIFWQVAGGAGVELGTTSRMEGNILARTAIHLRTGAALHGRAWAQTAVTLDKNRVVLPGFFAPAP